MAKPQCIATQMLLARCVDDIKRLKSECFKVQSMSWIGRLIYERTFQEFKQFRKIGTGAQCTFASPMPDLEKGAANAYLSQPAL